MTFFFGAMYPHDLTIFLAAHGNLRDSLKMGV